MRRLKNMTGCGLAGLGLLAVSAWAHAQIPVPDTIPGATRVNAEEMVELAESTPSLTIIDARIAMDRKQGYIQGSISLPDEDTDCNLLEMHIPDRNTPTLFYCNGVKCGRSVVSIEKAKVCGYTRLYWFRGGFEEWKDKKYPYLKE